MKSPMLYSADQIKHWDTEKKQFDSDGREFWIPARPVPRKSIKARFVLAFNVFVGKYDALYWMD